MVKNRPSLAKHNFQISVEDGGVVIVPYEILDDAPFWEDFLVGQFLPAALHVTKIHVIVNKIWPIGDKTIKIDVFVVSDKMVKFRIRDATFRSRILRRGMWNIVDIPMIVSNWTPIVEDAQPEIKTILMWITIKNVPHTMFLWKGLGFLASAVGESKRLHPETELCKHFDEVKVFVEADMSKELPKKFQFKVRKDEKVVVEFSYSWLPPRCQKYGKWGHLFESCVANSKSITILKRGETVRSPITSTPMREHILLKDKIHEQDNGVRLSLIQTNVVDTLLQVTETEIEKQQKK